MAQRHHCAATARTPQQCDTCIEPGRTAAHRPGSSIRHRSLSTVYSADTGEIPQPDRQSLACHGQGARLSGKSGSLPASHQSSSAQTACGSLFAAGHAARRTGSSGLGTLRSSHHWQSASPADGFCDGAVLVAAHLSAFLSGCQDGELFTRTCGCLRGLGRLAEGIAIRLCGAPHNRSYVPFAVMCPARTIDRS